MASVISYAAPVIIGCPEDITTTIVDDCTIAVTWTEPVGVAALSSTRSHAPGDPFPVGTTTVVYTFTDILGTSTCSFDVTVKYEFFDLPSNQVITVGTSCNRTASWSPPDDCDGNVVIAYSTSPVGDLHSGDSFPIGVTEVTYVALRGGTILDDIETFTITVVDNIAPTFDVVPGNITAAANNNCEAVVSWVIPTVLDNCTSGIVPTSPINPGATFVEGTTMVTYTAEDEGGNSATYSFNVTVEDQAGPEFTNLPNGITLPANAITCKATATWSEILASDNCSATVDIDASHNSGIDFNLGVTEVTYTATDDEGNETIESFNVTVVDSTDPEVVSCTSNVNVVATGSCEAVATWTAPVFSDSCDPTLVVVPSHTSGQTFPIGTTTVTYTATDDAGNETSCSFNVIVADATPPVFDACVSDITVTAGGGCTAVATWTAPTVSDNCSSGITPTADFNSGDSFPLGTTEVTFTAVDAAGNEATCSFNVIVEDHTGPQFTNLPSNREVPANTADCRAIATWNTVLATDNCASPVNDIITSHPSGSTFDIGVTEVTYTATDDEGNETIESFSITVVDGTPPEVISCPDDINVVAVGSCMAAAFWSAPIFSDGCDPTLTVTKSHSSGDAFPVGTTTVSYTATDDAGNEVSCFFDVIVTDPTSPVFSNCPSNITVIAGEDCNAVANWTAPTVFDNCSSEVSSTSDFNSGDTFPLGITEVVYTAMDESGNEVSCSFNVIVVDQSAPVFITCVDNIEIGTGETCGAVATWTAPSIADNCDENLTIAQSHNSGDTFALGITTVTYTATDEAGNETTCDFTITVVDQTAPEIANCPTDIEITTENCEAVVSWEELVATDNCSNVSTNANFSSGDTFPLGSTTVTYTFTDEVGNESQCSFNVNVINPTALVLSDCPDDIMVETDDSGRATVSWTEPSATSNCSEVVTSQSHQSGDMFEVGTTVVTYEFVDDFQAVVTCSFNVVVSIRDIEFDIPKLMTPNNDGNNDTWVLEGLENFPDNEVLVVDRWGGEIFKQSGYDNQRVVWDGTNQDGKIVPTGTYFYYITVKTTSSNQKKQGFIELVQ